MKRSISVKLWFDRARQDQLLPLIAAALIVGVAISIDGDLRKVVNGVGGILWLIAAWFIFRAVMAAGATWKQIAGVIIVILILSSLIPPRDPLVALLGFGWGGVAVGWLGRPVGSRLGALLGAFWLPAHLLIAVARAGIREVRDQPATLRSDPPPTAALVPLIMVLAAWVFACLMQDWLNRRDGSV
ncbi:MAG TPA: hypothetical protein PK691_01480 [Thermomicrobiales bacterium]|nr:hypothetical protein [Thermomicrobiales bacterium]